MNYSFNPIKHEKNRQDQYIILQLFKTDLPKKTCKIRKRGSTDGRSKTEKHAHYQLENRLNWEYLNRDLGPYYSEGLGCPEIPIRVVAGIRLLKYLENESDESVVEKFCENPYWQYFCCFKTFPHKLSCHPPHW